MDKWNGVIQIYLKYNNQNKILLYLIIEPRDIDKVHIIYRH